MKISPDTAKTSITRDVVTMSAPVGNVYEMVAILGKRANQISLEEKKEIDQQLADYASANENSFDEVFNNKEQASTSLQFEKMPKPSLIATQEFIEGKLSYTIATRDTLLDDDDNADGVSSTETPQV